MWPPTLHYRPQFVLLLVLGSAIVFLLSLEGYAVEPEAPHKLGDKVQCYNWSGNYTPTMCCETAQVLSRLAILTEAQKMEAKHCCVDLDDYYITSFIGKDIIRACIERYRERFVDVVRECGATMGSCTQPLALYSVVAVLGILVLILFAWSCSLRSKLSQAATHAAHHTKTSVRKRYLDAPAHKSLEETPHRHHDDHDNHFQKHTVEQPAEVVPTSISGQLDYPPREVVLAEQQVAATDRPSDYAFVGPKNGTKGSDETSPDALKGKHKRQPKEHVKEKSPVDKTVRSPKAPDKGQHKETTKKKFRPKMRLVGEED